MRTGRIFGAPIYSVVAPTVLMLSNPLRLDGRCAALPRSLDRCRL